MFANMAYRAEGEVEVIYDRDDDTYYISYDKLGMILDLSEVEDLYDKLGEAIENARS